MIWRAFVAFFVLVTFVPVTRGTTGGPEEIVSVSYIPGQHAVVFEYAEGPSFYETPPRFVTYELSTGRSFSSTQKPKDTTTLQPVDLTMLKLSATARAAWSIEHVVARMTRDDGSVIPNDINSKPFLLCPHSVRIRHKGQLVDMVTVPLCCYTLLSTRPRPIRLVGYAIPNSTYLAVVVHYLGLCYETGYTTSVQTLIPNVMTPPTGDSATSSSATYRSLTVPVRSHASAYRDLLRTLGERAEKQGEDYAASTYFERWTYAIGHKGIARNDLLHRIVSLAVRTGNFSLAYSVIERILSQRRSCRRSLKRILDDESLTPLHNNGHFKHIVGQAKYAHCH